MKSAGDVTGILSERSQQVNTLILNANDLLAVLDDRRQAIVDLLANTSAVSQQLTGVVADNEQELAPALEKLNSVNAMLEKNRDNITKALPGCAKYELTQGEIVSNGAYYNASSPTSYPAHCCSRSWTTHSGSGVASTPANRPTTPVRGPNCRSPTTAFRAARR